jgi:hypothetical protein
MKISQCRSSRTLGSNGAVDIDPIIEDRGTTGGTEKTSTGANGDRTGRDADFKRQPNKAASAPGDV